VLYKFATFDILIGTKMVVRAVTTCSLAGHYQLAPMDFLYPPSG